jgi:hypothetical protein
MRSKWRTAFTDTAPAGGTPPLTEAQRINALNARNREHYRDSGQPLRGHLVAELPAERFGIETADGVHRIYDRAPATRGGHDIADEIKLAKYDTEREKRDRASVADQNLSMPARLAALARLQRRAQR